MKNRIIALLVLLVLTVSVSNGQDTTKKEFRKVSQSAFGLGERLEYEISYGFLTAGYVVFEVSPNFVVMNGRNCFEISATLTSASSFEWVYKIQDRYKCYLDADGLFPWRFEQSIKEGDYTKEFTAIFDNANNKVKTTTVVKGETKPDGDFIITPYSLDIISAFYYARTMNVQNMNKGENISLTSFNDGKSYELKVKILDKETVEVPAGEFRAVIVQPFAEEGALMKKAENIAVWISQDERKIPIKVQLDILIGSVKGELTSYKNLAGPLNSKK
jgi:hypothetical protein